MCVGIGGSLPQERRRLTTASCLLSSHLGCQMCPFVGQDRCELGHSSSLVPLVQRGRGGCVCVWGVCVRTCVWCGRAPCPAPARLPC